MNSQTSAVAENVSLHDLVLEYSRQSRIAPLSPWFEKTLAEQIETGWFKPTHDLELVGASLVHWLKNYRIQTNASTVVLGMSGGVDSALTASLFKKAGYRVIGVTMPIHQNPEETERGTEACRALGIEHLHADLSKMYDDALTTLGVDELDPALGADAISKAVKIRRGNIRARLRMITLYNLASLNGGFVASTDNFSELLAGFWTLHGDVGDVSPIQSLLKSWEVPYLASIMGVPETTWRATPTDGLGVTAGGDEEQFGCSYLELDIMFGAVAKALSIDSGNRDDIYDFLDLDSDERAAHVYDCVLGRITGSWFKRKNPLNLDHPLSPERLGLIDEADKRFAHPAIIR